LDFKTFGGLNKSAIWITGTHVPAEGRTHTDTEWFSSRDWMSTTCREKYISSLDSGSHTAGCNTAFSKFLAGGDVVF